MKRAYYTTETAGPLVAGVKNPGVGLPVSLTPSQAEHPLRLGYLTEEAPKPSKKADQLDHDGDGKRGGSKKKGAE